jgi:hypothetical protein
LYFVPRVEIHIEMWPISDDRRNRRISATGPTRYPATRVPGRGTMLEAVYRQWEEVLLSSKLVNKCFKNKVAFLFGHTMYMVTTGLKNVNRCPERKTINKI